MSTFLKVLLYPFSLIFGIVVWFRNLLFSLNILKPAEFKLPVIAIGNITVGGTGKTPHTEYLIKFLRGDYNIAVLSRGYLRKTHSFRIAGENSTYEEIGDESLQIKRKFPDITVAVDRKRVNGIKKILEAKPETDVILLDDAYQHRWVMPGVNILLIDYERPVFNDILLPAGRLREPVSEKKRADIIIVTKAPYNISAMDKRLLLIKIDAQSHQQVYFTNISYAEIIPVFTKYESLSVNFEDPSLGIVLVTGIANSLSILNELKKKYSTIEHLNFPDHYSYQSKDIQKIEEALKNIPKKNKIILTTEKDAARLINFEYQINNHPDWFYLPIEIKFHKGDAEAFNRQILHYVTNNSRNSLLYKK